MKELIFLWNLMTLVAFGVIAVDIRVDPKMTQSRPSYIYCDVGTVTAGVTFFKDDQIQGSCFAPGVPCSSNQYTITQNTTGVLLEIAFVDALREEGEWDCQHDADRSTKVSLNHYKIPGVLLSKNWTKPSGPVDTFSAVMTLSCTNQVPDYNFTYIDGESNRTVPPEAVSIKPISTFNQTNCDKFYEITLTASDNLEDFKNKQGVKFTFIYYGRPVTTPFSVNFIEATTTPPEPTTATPTSTATTTSTEITKPVCENVIICIIVGCIGGVAVVTVIFICCCCCSCCLPSCFPSKCPCCCRGAWRKKRKTSRVTGGTNGQTRTTSAEGKERVPIDDYPTSEKTGGDYLKKRNGGVDSEDILIKIPDGQSDGMRDDRVPTPDGRSEVRMHRL